MGRGSKVLEKRGRALHTLPWASGRKEARIAKTIHPQPGPSRVDIYSMTNKPPQPSPEFPFESLRELWRITEYRDGAVYKTEFVKEVWVGFGYDGEEQPPEGHMFVGPSRYVEGSPRRRGK